MVLTRAYIYKRTIHALLIVVMVVNGLGNHIVLLRHLFLSPLIIWERGPCPLSLLCRLNKTYIPFYSLVGEGEARFGGILYDLSQGIPRTWSHLYPFFKQRDICL